VGINTASLGAGVSAGVGFAIPIDVAKGIVDQLIKFGQVQRAVLGISYLERLPSPAESERSGIPRIEKGIVVLEVPATSPCGKAGMIAVTRPSTPGAKPVIGDVIVSIDKYTINVPADLNNVSCFVCV
jgi:S1-C subfamily serine protease